MIIFLLFNTRKANFHQSVLGFLTFLSCGLQYVIQRVNYKRDIKRVETIMNEARLAAWGPKMIPLEGQRKVRGLTNHSLSY